MLGLSASHGGVIRDARPHVSWADALMTHLAVRTDEAWRHMPVGSNNSAGSGDRLR